MQFYVPLIILGFAQLASADQVAQCLGTLVLDNSPVTAKIYSDNKIGRIEIETSIDTVESEAKVDLSSDLSAAVSGNKFQMNFSVSHGRPISPIQAFRDGAFFVEDFYCVRVN